jgi:hypothetical protein
MNKWDEIEDIIIDLKYPLSFFYLLNKNYDNNKIKENYDYICALFIKYHCDLFFDYPMEILLNNDNNFITNRNINTFLYKLRKLLNFSKTYYSINKLIKNPQKKDLLTILENKKKIFDCFFGNVPIYYKYQENILNNCNIFIPIIKDLLRNSVKLFGIKFFNNFDIKIITNYEFDLLSPKDKLLFINKFHIDTQKALDLIIYNLINYNEDKKLIKQLINYKKLHIEVIDLYLY